MEESRRSLTAGNLVHACAPLALYYLISSAASFICMQILALEAGFAVLESGSGDVYDYILQEYPGKILQMVLLTAAVAVPAFGWLYYRDLREREGFSFRSMVIVLEVRPAAWAMAGSVCLALALNLLLLASPLPDWSAGFEQTQEALYQGSIWMELAVSGVAAAVMEELLMRGLFYGRLREMMEPGRAVFWSALAFAICHGNLVQGIYAFLMGCLLAFLKERFRTIWIPILAHMCANIAVIFMSESGGMDFLLQRPFLAILAVLAGALTAALSLLLVWVSGQSVSEKTERDK